MKYTIQRLDKRYSHSDLFQYYVGFTSRMQSDRGPEYFNDALQWFTRTYGWSAEIKQYKDIKRYNTAVNTVAHLMKQKFGNHPLGAPNQYSMPSCCNESWSWSNLYNDLRIYVATDRELAFFQLSHPTE